MNTVACEHHLFVAAGMLCVLMGGCNNESPLQDSSANPLASVRSDAKVAAAKVQMAELEDAIEVYVSVIGTLPLQRSDLVEPPVDQSAYQQWANSGPFLSVKSIPPDPWGQAYGYTQSRDSFTIISAGPDGQWGSKDDIAINGSR